MPLRQVESDLPRAVRTNVEGTCNVFDAVVKAKDEGRRRPWLFLASTSHVYESNVGLLSETSALGPMNAILPHQTPGGGVGEPLRPPSWSRPVHRAHFQLQRNPEQPKSYFIPAIIGNSPPRHAARRLKYRASMELATS